MMKLVIIFMTSIVSIYDFVGDTAFLVEYPKGCDNIYVPSSDWSSQFFCHKYNFFVTKLN
jgi:hypothetical protein|uniref:Uncharacterized protein n=1 Tax=viral metagenome TaxID=1070528 RepID=A0A6C0IWI5_9ZZZZ